MTAIGLLALGAALGGLVIAVVATWLVWNARSSLVLAVAVASFLFEFDAEPTLGPSGNRLIGAAGTLIVAAAAIPAGQWIWRNRARYSANWLWLVLLGIAGIVTAPLSALPRKSMESSVLMVLLVIVVVAAVDRYGFDRTAMAVALALAGVVFASAAWEWFGPGTPPLDPSGVFDPGIAGLPRLAGVTIHANQLGRVGALTIMLAATGIGRWPAIAAYGGHLVGALGLYLSQSRTSIIAALVVMVGVHWLRGNYRSLALAFASIAAGVLALVSAGYSLVELTTRDEAGSKELMTATGRSKIWSTALDIGWENPVVGGGAYTAESALEAAIEVGQLGPLAVDAHNVLINTFLTQGLLGTFLLVAFIAWIWIGPRPQSAEATAARLLLLGLGVFGLTENILWTPNASLIVAAAAAARLSAAAPATNVEGDVPKPVSLPL